MCHTSRSVERRVRDLHIVRAQFPHEPKGPVGPSREPRTV